MEHNITPPEYILSRLGIRTVDELGRDNNSMSIEASFQPAKRYSAAVHGETLYLLLNSAKDFYVERDIQTYGLDSYARDMLTNSIYHGPQDREIFLSAYLTLDVKVLACNDGGNYFKDPIVKHNWENKVKLSKQQRHDVKSKDVGYGIGQSYLFNEINQIFIDANHGTLYMIQPVVIPRK